MIAFILLPIYIIIHIYLIKYFLRWMCACDKHFNNKKIRLLIIVLCSFLASTLLIGFFLPVGPLQRTMNAIGNYWYGTLLYTLLILPIGWIIYQIGKKKISPTKVTKNRLFVIVGTLCIFTIISISIYGSMNAKIIHETNYEITINKTTKNIKELKIVMIADLHIGYNIGTKHITKMVEKINKQNPDLIVLAGDIFDNAYEAMDHPNEIKTLLQSMKAKYGVYAVYGNHDIKEKTLAGFTFQYKTKKESDIRMDTLLEEAGITLLRDEYIQLENEVYLYGRPDYSKPGRGIDQRKTPQEITKIMDSTKPMIIIDHQPRELEQLQEAGVDLLLSGHTHDGQLFPGNWLMKIVWENSYGHKKIKNFHSIVTSGVGVYGPNMRVGTKAEITVIHIRFETN